MKFADDDPFVVQCYMFEWQPQTESLFSFGNNDDLKLKSKHYLHFLYPT
jgi:hypothetical protein